MSHTRITTTTNVTIDCVLAIECFYPQWKKNEIGRGSKTISSGREVNRTEKTVFFTVHFLFLVVMMLLCLKNLAANFLLNTFCKNEELLSYVHQLACHHLLYLLAVVAPYDSL